MSVAPYWEKVGWALFVRLMIRYCRHVATKVLHEDVPANQRCGSDSIERHKSQLN